MHTGFPCQVKREDCPYAASRSRPSPAQMAVCSGRGLSLPFPARIPLACPLLFPLLIHPLLFLFLCTPALPVLLYFFIEHNVRRVFFEADVYEAMLTKSTTSGFAGGR